MLKGKSLDKRCVARMLELRLKVLLLQEGAKETAIFAQQIMPVDLIKASLPHVNDSQRQEIIALLTQIPQG